MEKVTDNHVKLVSCIICGREFEHEPHQGGFADTVCDGCKNAIEYAKLLMQNNILDIVGEYNNGKY